MDFSPYFLNKLGLNPVSPEVLELSLRTNIKNDSFLYGW